MIIDFKDTATADIYHGFATKRALKVPQIIWPAARRKLDMLEAAHDVRDLQAPPGNRLETLKGGLRDRYSIRINDQYRIVFRWESGNAFEVQIVDYH